MSNDTFISAVVVLLVVALSLLFVGVLIWGGAALGDYLGMWRLPDQTCEVPS